MSLNLYDEYGSGGWSPSKIVGVALTALGAGVILWTVAEIFQLFTHGSAFIVLNEIVPKRIVISESGNSAFLLPRELLIYGIPIWALSVTTKIGTALMKSGLQYVEMPRKNDARRTTSS